MKRKYERKKYQIYAIYKGDKFIDEGTVPELSKRNNWAYATVYAMCSKSYLKRVKRKDKCLVGFKIGETGD